MSLGTVLLVIQIISGIILSFLVLIQNSKAGLSRTVSTNISFGKRGVENIVFRSTFILASIFIVASLFALLV